MANPFRGIVPLKAGDEEYKLSLSINAICEIEEHFGKPISEVAKEMDGDGFQVNTFRFVLWAALQDHHQELTLKDAGNIASNAGVDVCADAIGKAFQLMFPSSEKTGGKGNARPRRAAGR